MPDGAMIFVGSAIQGEGLRVIVLKNLAWGISHGHPDEAHPAPHLTLVKGSAPALAARLSFRHRSPLRIQVVPDLGVTPVYIPAKLQPAIAIREGGLVHHEYRHGLRQSASGGAARRDRLIDRIDRLLHQQGRQLPRILHPDASMTDAAVVAAE
jgi:hypothetical protein